MDINMNVLLAVAAVKTKGDEMKGIEELSLIRDARILISQFDRCEAVRAANVMLDEGIYTTLDHARQIIDIASTFDPPIDMLERRICALQPAQMLYQKITATNDRQAAMDFDHMIVELLDGARRGKY